MKPLDFNKIILDEIEDKIAKDVLIPSSVDVWYPVSPETNKTQDTYATEDSVEVNRENYIMYPGHSPFSLVNTIRNKSILIPPIIIISVDFLESTYNDLMQEIYSAYTENTNIKKKDQIFIFREESYNTGVKCYKYKIDNNKLIFLEELPSDGKKFLPYIN
jgi:hypothetical protein